MEWDVFISHASEDKESIARPLSKLLRERGLTVWFDESTITIGDSLRRSIDDGLSRSRFGVVIISHSFLKNEWPQRELDGLVAREIDGVKVILPVWHEISREEVRSYSPTLADKLAASSENGLDCVADKLLEAIKKASLYRSNLEISSPTPTPYKAIVYCNRCGSLAGEKSICVGSYKNHNFLTANATNIYCNRCGVMTGKKSTCTGAHISHNFITESSSTIYCNRCGVLAGEKSVCSGSYINHNFIAARGATIYCNRCGAKPGMKSICTGSHISHNFTET